MDLPVYPRISGEAVSKKVHLACVIGKVMSWSPKDKKMVTCTD